MARKYFVRKSTNELYQDIEQNTLWDGVKILKIEGFLTRGKPLNVYHQQWNDSQTEDFMVCSDNGNVLYANTDITISFIVCNEYAQREIDVVNEHDKFIRYMTNGEVYVKSKYVHREVRCVCLEEYKPTQIHLHRDKEYILGTLQLHKLDTEVTFRA